MKYNITQEVLYDLYLLKKLPLSEIAAFFGCDRSLIAMYAKKFGLPSRNKSPIKRYAGEKVGSWVLLESFKRNHHTYWRCQCKCGTVSDVEVSSLNRRNQSLGCKACGMERTRDNRPVPNYYWRKFVLQASRRGHKVEITHDFVEQLWVEQQGVCALSGLPLRFVHGCRERKSLGTTASLDRKDSSLEYASDNVWWVHKKINLMKHQLSVSDFCMLCQQVAKTWPETQSVELSNHWMK